MLCWNINRHVKSIDHWWLAQPANPNSTPMLWAMLFQVKSLNMHHLRLRMEVERGEKRRADSDACGSMVKRGERWYGMRCSAYF
jgi:hypothetical protein